jgi:hypothetical protein
LGALILSTLGALTLSTLGALTLPTLGALTLSILGALTLPTLGTLIVSNELILEKQQRYFENFEVGFNLHLLNLLLL